MAEVDVVIPTFNRHDALLACLRAVAKQDVPDVAVYVVDDGSSPAVDEAACREAVGERPLRVLRTKGNSGPAAARNLGVAEGSAPHVCFIDDDVRPASGLVGAHQRALAGGGARASIGPLIAPESWRPTPWNDWEARTLAVEYRRMMEGEYAPTWRQFFTGNAMLPRDTFERAGGFDTSLPRAEDIEFAWRLHRDGVGFVFTPGALGYHFANRSASSWLRIPRQYAEVDVAIDSRFPDMGWLRHLETEQRGLRWKAYETIVHSSVASEGLSRVALGGAYALHRAGLRDAAMPALSAAFNIRYSRRRRELATQGRGSEPAQAAPQQGA